MTSDKAYDAHRRIDALVARPGLASSFDTWHDTSAMTNGWGKSTGYFKYKLLDASWIYLSAKLLTPGTVSEGIQIVTTALPSAYRPATGNQRFPVYATDVKAGQAGTPGPATMAAFELRTDGTIVSYGVYVNATRIDCNALIPLDL